MKFKATVIVLFFPFFMMSQEKTSLEYINSPLSEVIVDIEKKFNIKLSYNSELIDTLFITFQSNEASLQDIFIAIEAQTNIEFSMFYFKTGGLNPDKLRFSKFMHEFFPNRQP
ncbi:MAG: hypothetical protein IIC74_06470 [Bacteroidetes bacterium]|nr:hypothetical protein [Bacteroidota bacterium]